MTRVLQNVRGASQKREREWERWVLSDGLREDALRLRKLCGGPLDLRLVLWVEERAWA